MNTVQRVLSLTHLRLGKKFIVLSILIAIPISLLGYFFFVEKLAVINATKVEISGMQHITPVKELIRHLQQHRGSTATYLGGKLEFKEKMISLQAKISEDINIIEKENAANQSSYEVENDWKNIEQSWKELKSQVFQLQAGESFTKHTDLINKTMSLITLIADKSNLTLDPEAITFYLMDIATSKSIFVTEYLGRLRAKGSNAIAKNDLSLQTKSQIISLMSISKESIDKMFEELEKVYSADPGIRVKIAQAEENAKRSTDVYYRSAQEGIVNAVAFSIDPKKYFDQATIAIDDVFSVYEVAAAELTSALAVRQTHLSNRLYLVILICGIAIMLLVVMFIGIVTSIKSNIHQIVSGAEQMASGNTTVSVTINTHDEIGDLAHSFNKMVHDIQDTLLKVSEASSAVASASTEISSSTEQMAAGAQEQSTQASEVASAVEEMTKTIQENNSNVNKVVQASKSSQQLAGHGATMMKETITGMNEISDVVSDGVSKVQVLGKSSEQIGEIITVINDIADQTNLLALNAAIEAARAGEQGRGFAVVADEVRKLAERTTKATKEIAGMIKQIQIDTREAVVSMENGTKKVSQGIELANKTGNTLQQIMDGVTAAAEMTTQIATASEQQASASGLISKNVEGISSVTQETALGVQQIAKTAEDLNRLTDNLQQLLEKFNLGTEEQRETTADKSVYIHKTQKSKKAVSENGQLVEHY